MKKLTKKKAQQLRTQVERDLIRDIKKLRDEVRITAESLSRRYP